MNPVPAPTAPEPALWTVRDCAWFLACGERWIWTSLRRPETEKGSIPHLRLPTGHPRFDPEEVREWVREGCPPAGTFRKWRKEA